jgi:hypothetical protein
MSTPIPYTRVTTDNPNILLNNTANVDIMFKNNSSIKSAIGFKGCADIFVQYGLVNQTSFGSNFIYVGDWINTFDLNGAIISSEWKDSNGNPITTHPYSSSGLTLPINPNTGAQTNQWRWYFAISPYSSYGSDQPEFLLQEMSLQASSADGAIIGSPLSVRAKPWFMYGADALDNSSSDPSIVGTIQSTTITPQLLLVKKSHNKTESETVTGPNYPVQYTIKVDIASGVSLSNVNIIDNISKYMLLYDPNTAVNNSILGNIINSPNNYQPSVNAVQSRKNLTIPNNSNPTISQQTLSWNIGTITGIGGGDLVFSYQTYVPHTDITGSVILDQTMQSSRIITDNVTVGYTYNTNSLTVTTNSPLTIKPLCIQKTSSSNSQTIIPSSSLTYVLRVQLSDFFVMDSTRIVDILSDGHILQSEQQQATNFTLTYKNATYNFDQSDISITDNSSEILNTNNTIVDNLSEPIANKYTLNFNLGTIMQAINENTSTFAKGGLVKYNAGISEYADPYTESYYNFVTNNSGSFQFAITYHTTIDQIYYGKTLELTDMDNPDYHNKLDIGDFVYSTVSVYGDDYNWFSNTTYGTTLNDSSATRNDIGSIIIENTIYAINGTVLNTNAIQHIKSNDLVTYRIKINMSHQNFQSFTINSYLPTPIMTVQNINNSFNTNAPNASVPDTGMFKYGPTHTLYDTDDTKFKNPDQLTVDSSSVSLSINYENFQYPYDVNNYTNGSICSKIIDILYTLQVNDSPTADQLQMTNQAVYSVTSTFGKITTGNSSVPVIVDQPIITIDKAVVTFAQTSTDTTLTQPLPLPLSISQSVSGFTVTQPIVPDTAPITNGILLLNRGDQVKYLATVKNIGNNTAYNVTIMNDQTVGGNGSIPDATTLLVYDGAGNLINIIPTKNMGGQNNNTTNYTSTTGYELDSIPANSGASSVRIIIYVATVRTNTTEIILGDSIVDDSHVIRYSNISSGTNFLKNGQTVFSNCTITFRDILATRQITYRSNNPTDLSDRTTDSATIGEIVRITSNVKIPPGKITLFGLKDQLDIAVGTATRAGMESINTEIMLSGGATFTGTRSGTISDVLANHTTSGGYRTYNFGAFTNNNTTDTTVTLVQYIRLTNSTFNGKYIFGQSGISTSYSNKSVTSIQVQRTLSGVVSTIATSPQTTINVKEPKITLSKTFHPSQTTYYTGSLITYRIRMQSNASTSTIDAKNITITDNVPNIITVSSAYLSGQQTNPFSTNTNNVTYSTNNLSYNNATLDVYITGIVGAYRTGDSVTNTVSTTFNSLDSTKNMSSYYVIPSDDSNGFDPNVLSKIYRSYTLNKSLSFTTYPTISHQLVDTTYTHPVISSRISGAIGDTMQSTVTINIPPGITYITDIRLTLAVPITNIIPSNDSIDLTFPTDITYKQNDVDMNILSITPNTTTYLTSNQVQFPFNKMFTNTGSAIKNLTFIYKYRIKNTKSNASGFLVTTNYNLNTTNTTNASRTTTSGNVEYYIVEPSIVLSNQITQIPLSPIDTFTIQFTLTSSSSSTATVAFRPKWSYSMPSQISSYVNITIPTGWTESIDGSVHTFTYNSTDSNGNILLAKNTQTVFVVQYQIDPLANIEYRDHITVGSQQVVWVSRNSFDPNSFDPDLVRLYNNDTTNNRANNYISTSTVDVYVVEPFEKLRFGLMFEDALDFDYDYKDLVLNVMYEIYRNKNGIKRMVADFHVVARGASNDHTLGIKMNGLLTLPNGSQRSGTWNSTIYTGNNDTVTQNNSAILSYLGRSSGSSKNLTALRENCIPVIISTKKILPADGAKVGYPFSSNAANRTQDVPNWVSPTTVRMILDLSGGSEIVDNSQYFLPYIDVRNSSNNSVTPSYNDYQYRKILGGSIDFSRRYFTYNGVNMSYTKFPVCLVTPVDFRIVQDYGYTPPFNGTSYHSLREAYTNFVSYITNGKYPSVTNMVDMADIGSRLNEVILQNSWCNDDTYIATNNLMKIKSSDYSGSAFSVNDKESFNEYNNRNIFSIKQYADISGNTQIFSPNASVYTIGTNPSTTLPTYASSINMSTTNKICDITKNNINGDTQYAITETDISNNNFYTRSSSNISGISNSPYTNESVNIIKLAISSNQTAYIDTSGTLRCTDTNHDTTLHNASGRSVYDACYFNNTDIISIGRDNTLVRTTISESSNINLANLTSVIKIICSDTCIVVLTALNTVFIMDNNDTQIQIFNDYKITDIGVSTKNVIGLDINGNLYLYDILMGISSGTNPTQPLATNVEKFSQTSDWVAVLLQNGTIRTFQTAGNIPDIPLVDGQNYIAKSGTNCYIDVFAINDMVIAKYI